MALIDREALMAYPIRLDHYDKVHGNEDFVLGIESVLEYAEALPVADAVPVVHARWIDTGKDYWERGRTSTRYKCSSCGRKAGEKQVKLYYYCPNCGATMDGKE